MSYASSRSPWLLAALSVVVVLPEAAARPSAPWVVSAARATHLVAKGALLVDVRKHAARRIAGVPVVDWRAFSRRATQGGRLRPAVEVAARLRELGVSAQRWVLVFDEPLKGWGEDGRVVWMLRTLGHRRAAMVDGGYAALVAAGLRRAPASTTKGTFTAQKGRRWSIGRAGVAKLLASRARGEVVLVDTRERREFEGATPYGERRGGHLPGAVHLHYKELLGHHGKLLSASAAQRLLRARGITRDKRVVAYCTGGVRSAWFVAVLAKLGYRRVANYPGSMWQWAAGPPARYPLAKPKPTTTTKTGARR